MNNVYKMTMEELTEEMSRSLLQKMVEASKDLKLSNLEVENIAKGFMAGYPYSRREELLEAVYEATKDYSFLLSVYVKYKAEFEEEDTSKKLENIRRDIKNSGFEEGVKYGS